jgi:Ankyrin repeats (3 copies)
MGFLRNLFSSSPPAPPKDITKKDIKTLFRAIRNEEIQTVKELVAANQAFVNVCAFAPPKKDDGQSPLQVSLKTGRFAIADFLIEKGANVNFMEESQINEWRFPVLHDAIRAAVFSSEVGRFDLAIRIIRKMLERGAHPNGVDSYGNTCLMRTILDARIRIPRGFESSASTYLLADIGEVFKALIKAGADVNAKGPNRPSAVEETRGTILERFVV